MVAHRRGNGRPNNSFGARLAKRLVGKVREAESEFPQPDYVSTPQSSPKKKKKTADGDCVTTPVVDSHMKPSPAQIRAAAELQRCWEKSGLVSSPQRSAKKEHQLPELSLHHDDVSTIHTNDAEIEEDKSARLLQQLCWWRQLSPNEAERIAQLPPYQASSHNNVSASQFMRDARQHQKQPSSEQRETKNTAAIHNTTDEMLKMPSLIQQQQSPSSVQPEEEEDESATTLSSSSVLQGSTTGGSAMRDEAASTVDGDALTAKSQSPLELLASEAFHVASIDTSLLLDDDDYDSEQMSSGFQTPSPNDDNLGTTSPKADQQQQANDTESEDGSVGLVESPAIAKTPTTTLGSELQTKTPPSVASQQPSRSGSMATTPTATMGLQTPTTNRTPLSVASQQHAKGSQFQCQTPTSASLQTPTATRTPQTPDSEDGNGSKVGTVQTPTATRTPQTPSLQNGSGIKLNPKNSFQQATPNAMGLVLTPTATRTPQTPGLQEGGSGTKINPTTTAHSDSPTTSGSVLTPSATRTPQTPCSLGNKLNPTDTAHCDTPTTSGSVFTPTETRTPNTPGLQEDESGNMLTAEEKFQQNTPTTPAATRTPTTSVTRIAVTPRSVRNSILTTSGISKKTTLTKPDSQKIDLKGLYNRAYQVRWVQLRANRRRRIQAAREIQYWWVHTTNTNDSKGSRDNDNHNDDNLQNDERVQNEIVSAPAEDCMVSIVESTSDGLSLAQAKASENEVLKQESNESARQPLFSTFWWGFLLLVLVMVVSLVAMAVVFLTEDDLIRMLQVSRNHSEGGPATGGSCEVGVCQAEFY